MGLVLFGGADRWDRQGTASAHFLGMALYLRNSTQPIISTIVPGGAGTAIGTYFQDRSHQMTDEQACKKEYFKK
eukprot:330764-Ditylum_brightwellii.AAC.1